MEYHYDAWGNPAGVTGSKAGTVGVQNPFRYRGYYYDNETGMYYLQSRYYDPVYPEIRRFISADTVISNTILKKNGWTKVSSAQTKYHDNRKGKEEKKYTHTDGREIVFDGDTLKPVLDPKYMGTYNFCPIQQLPEKPTVLDYVNYVASGVGHGIMDVAPYIIWGNSPDDPTSMGERIMMSFN